MATKIEMLIKPEFLADVLVVEDGGCRNQQFPDKREGYGSFVVIKKGDIVPSTRLTKVSYQHFFDWGRDAAPMAEMRTLLEALMYMADLRSRGYKGRLVIGTDSEHGLKALKGVKKADPKFKDIYFNISHYKQMIEATGELVAIKLDEGIVKQILGH